MGGRQCGGEEGICDVSVYTSWSEFVNVDEERLHELTQVGESGRRRSGPGEDEGSQQGEGYS